ncbi:MAG: MFS transporter [Myxococcota bacterium]|nr:MFS transporter [Myxococcota bacterium]
MSKTRLDGYQWRLLAFLSVATFFEGFDFMALSQILPEIRQEMGLSLNEAGLMISVINIGTVFAFLLIRKADAWGRRRVLTITIAGYTIFTGLTALSQSIWDFTLFQMIARMFLIAEWATAMVFAAEEFPADKRGLVIGLTQGFASLGSIVCAGVAPLLLSTDLGWRMVYLVGIVPLLLVAFARRGLQETKRFKHQTAPRKVGLMDLLSGPYRDRVLLMGLLWALTYLGMSNAVTFWKDFAVTQRGYTDGEVGMALTIAAVISMPMVFASGKLLDVVGRRAGAAVIYIGGMIGVAAAFTLTDATHLNVALIFAIFGVSGVLPVLNAYSTELFPTDVRGDAFGWANNLLGRIGYVLAPALVGFSSLWIGLGNAMAVSMIFPLIALVILLMTLPETSGRELEDTSSLAR